MADNVVVSAGTGTTVAADEVVDGTLGTVKVQYVKIMDATLDGTTKAAVGANGLAADVKAIAAGTNIIGKFGIDQTTDGTTNAVHLVAGTAIAGKVGIDQTTDLTTNKVRAFIHDGTTALPILAASSGSPAASVPAIPVSIRDINVNGQAAMTASAPVTIANNQAWQTGMSPRGIVAAFTTLTRPANTTAYTALDSISDNATAGSVTALSATLSDTNDDPVTVTDIVIKSTDTGLAGKRIRAYLFNSDPTASTGVGGGDNAAYSQKVAGYIGSFSGVLESGFSDGTVGRLVPSYADGAAAGTPHAPAGGFIVVKPTSGAKTLFIQYQAVDGFTPSANSTTIIGTARGYQGRAA